MSARVTMERVTQEHCWRERGGSLTRVRPPNLGSSYIEINLVLPSIILYIVLDLHLMDAKST